MKPSATMLERLKRHLPACGHVHPLVDAAADQCAPGEAVLYLHPSALDLFDVPVEPDPKHGVLLRVTVRAARDALLSVRAAPTAAKVAAAPPEGHAWVVAIAAGAVGGRALVAAWPRRAS